MFINARGVRKNADPDLAAFLDMVIGKESNNDFAQHVKKAVDIVKLDREGRHRYMTVEMWIREEAEKAAEEAAEATEKKTCDDILTAVRRLKEGEAPEHIMADGISPKTVETALNCIS